MTNPRPKSVPDHFSTIRPEASLSELCSTHDRVIVQDSRVCERRIPLRRNLIPDIRFYRHRTWTAVGRDHLAQWRESGGVLVDEPRVPSESLFDRVGGMLLVETPLRMTTLAVLTRGVTGQVVIHKPANWEGHEEQVDMVAPDSEKLELMDAALRRLSAQPKTPLQQEVGRLLGLDGQPFVAIDNDGMAELTGLPAKECPMLLYWVASHCGYRAGLFQGLIPRFPPNDPALRTIHDYAMSLPVIGRGERIQAERELFKSVPSWKVLLRRANAEGYVERRRRLHTMVFLPGKQLRLAWLRQNRRTAETELRVIREFVEGLPDHPSRQ